MALVVRELKALVKLAHSLVLLGSQEVARSRTCQAQSMLDLLAPEIEKRAALHLACETNLCLSY